MSGQQIATPMQERPIPEGYASWPDYWTAQGMPWRTKPEINEERQRELDRRRYEIKPDIRLGIYPFNEVKLDRDDVEWLLAATE